MILVQSTKVKGAFGSVGRALGSHARSPGFDPQALATAFFGQFAKLGVRWFPCRESRSTSLGGVYSGKIPGTGKFFVGACASSSENSLGAARNVLALAVDDR